MNINKVIITGNITHDSELRTSQSGLAILSFSVAVNDRKKNQTTGQWEDYANFINCTIFGNRATAIAQYLTKGTKVAIDGKLQWKQWMKDDEKRSSITVIVNEIELLGSQKINTSRAPQSSECVYPDYSNEETPF